MIKNRIAIVGAGPAGVFSAIFAAENPQNEIFIFDKNDMLLTLLPTGNGRCNLAFEQADFKELALFYPRGEKFLYSIFSQFALIQTLEYFNKIGVKTYSQKDKRVFPISNSAKDVRQKLLIQLKKQKNVFFVKENVLEVKKENKFIIKTQQYEQIFDKVIIATGSKTDLKSFLTNINLEIIDFKPSLCPLEIKENCYFSLSGVVLKNIKYKNFSGDLLFTHNSISGPLAYKISAYNVETTRPYEVIFELFDGELKEILNKHKNKTIVNALLQTFLPKSFLKLFLETLKINPEMKVNSVKKEEILLIERNLKAFKLNVTNYLKGGEIVNFGGVSLKELNSKTLECKKIKNLYFCGEALNIDGLTGGFNLQNCWSTGFVAGHSLC